MVLDLPLGRLIDPLTGRAWDREVVIDRGGRRAAYYADLGLAPFDRVLLHHGNTLEFFVDLLAIWSLGGCVVPIDPRLSPFEVETLARAAAPRYSIWKETPEGALSKSLADLGVRILDVPGVDAGAERIAPRTPYREVPSLDQDALILFTSGSTGQPKGVVHTHRSLGARWTSLRDRLGLDVFRRTLCPLPTHFGHGLICNSLFPWLLGGDLFILPPARADVLARLGSILDEHEITFMSSVPALWRVAFKTARPPRARTLKRVICGSAPLSAALWNSIQEWTGAPEVFNAYGITETGSWLAGTTVPGFVPEDGLIGVAWGGAVKISRSGTTRTPPTITDDCAPGEPGYIWARTPALMRGYLGRDDLTQEVVTQGWFLTGDIGVIDERGLLYLRGREREEINKDGLKVYPGDIDAVVHRFEATIDTCSFGFEDPLHGEDVAIAVVLTSADDVTLRRLYEWTNRHLARHQMPQRWYVVDGIPRTASGKINRATVAERCATRQPVEMRRLVARGSSRERQ